MDKIEDITDGKALVITMLKEKLVGIQKNIDNLEKMEQEAKNKLSYIPKSITRLKASMEVVRNELKQSNMFICEFCAGNGKVLVQYDQDDVKNEDCAICKGKGYLEGQELNKSCLCGVNNWIVIADDKELNKKSPIWFKCMSCGKSQIKR